MKKRKIQNSYVTSSNGSRQQLNLLSYNNQSDLTENDFVGWDVLNADLVKRLVSQTSSNPLSSLAIRNSVLRPTPQDGLLEYDGTHLYFTIGTTRKTVTLA